MTAGMSMGGTSPSTFAAGQPDRRLARARKRTDARQRRRDRHRRHACWARRAGSRPEHSDRPVIARDPVRTGLAKSLNRPGGLVTGLTTLSPELNLKRLELRRAVLP